MWERRLPNEAAQRRIGIPHGVPSHTDAQICLLVALDVTGEGAVHWHIGFLSEVDREGPGGPIALDEWQSVLPVPGKSAHGMRFRRRFFSAISFISDIKESPCRQTWPAICRNGATHPMLAAKLRDRHIALSLLQHRHNLRVAVSSVLHRKSPRISCRENSTFEYH